MTSSVHGSTVPLPLPLSVNPIGSTKLCQRVCAVPVLELRYFTLIAGTVTALRFPAPGRCAESESPTRNAGMADCLKPCVASSNFHLVKSLGMLDAGFAHSRGQPCQAKGRCRAGLLALQLPTPTVMGLSDRPV